MNSYRLIVSDGYAAIRCLICGKTSYHPKDIEHRYCGFCRRFHAETSINSRAFLAQWLDVKRSNTNEPTR